jgi:eukaryotic-like serine/threonine-protein kinase
MRMPSPGQIIAGKYELIRELGKGGMGSVWRARHLALHSDIALKLIESTQGDTREDADRFLREARTAAGLRSQHVVQTFDYGVADGTPYIAMELLEGETLRQRLTRKGRLPLAETCKIVQHVARALERAHQASIVHRDIKPENMIIVDSEDGEIVKVLDFGIAKASLAVLTGSIDRATPTGAILGTPHYMSPEQTQGSKSLDYRTDLWSLGVIAYECLLGCAPFGGDTLGALILAVCVKPIPVPSDAGSVVEGFDLWFSRACAREPSQRFDSARQMAEDLATLSRVQAQAATTASVAVDPLLDAAAARSDPRAGLPASAPAPAVPEPPFAHSTGRAASLRTGSKVGAGVSRSLGVAILGLVLAGALWLGIRAAKDHPASESVTSGTSPTAPNPTSAGADTATPPLAPPAEQPQAPAPEPGDAQASRRVDSRASLEDAQPVSEPALRPRKRTSTGARAAHRRPQHVVQESTEAREIPIRFEEKSPYD